MLRLELKIPPPIVALLIATVMWGVSLVTPTIPLTANVRLVATIAIFLAGVAMAIAGVLGFRRAKTTLNPFKPADTSSLVTSGVYRLTRNPMYVGLALGLLAWAIFLSSTWSLLGPLLFILYITRFQILPEERALSRMFGAAYSEYQAKVRRWL